MTAFDMIRNSSEFATASGILFLMLVIGFVCLVVVLRTSFARIKAASRVETVKAHPLPGWIARAVGILCMICGIAGMWVGIVLGIAEQVFFTRAAPEPNFPDFEPLGLASIVFGTLLTLFSACLLVLGIILSIEKWLRTK